MVIYLKGWTLLSACDYGYFFCIAASEPGVYHDLDERDLLGNFRFLEMFLVLLGWIWRI